MRILVCTDHYPPFIGGAHRWAELIAHGLAERGHTVAVLTAWHGGLPRRELTGAVEVHRIRQARTAVRRLVTGTAQRHMPPLPDPVSIFDANAVISEFAADVAIVHGWIAASTTPLLSRRKIPTLLSTHDYGYFCPTRTLQFEGAVCSGPAPRKCIGCASAFYESRAKGVACVAGVAALKRTIPHTVDGIQTVSSFVDEVTWGNLGDRMRPDAGRFVIPAFVDDDPEATTSDERRTEEIIAALPEVPFIMFAGALRRIKGVDVLLDAYRQIPDPPPLVLMGTMHEDTPTDLPLGVTIVENAPHPAVMEGWRRAVVGVVPSVWPDPCPTVAIECQSQGTPVIGTVPGGMSDTVGDAGGILVPMRDPRALADAISRVIGDPELRGALSAGAKEKASRLTGRNAVEAYERALETLVSA